MNTRPRIIGFHALSDGRFVKINDKKQVEICNGESSIYIEVKKAPDSLIKTCLVEIENGKIILVYSSNVVKKTLIALLDLNTANCLSTEFHEVGRDFLSLLPDNTFALGSKHFGGAMFSYLNNRLREISRDYLPNGRVRRMVMLENKTVLYATDHPARLVLAIFSLQRDFKKDYEKKVERWIDQNGSIMDVALLTHDDIVCWAYHNSRDYLHFFDGNLNPRTCVELKYHSFQQMVILGNQFIAMMSKKNLEFYVEVYNKKGEKVREILMSNRSDQLFTVTLEGILVSCSRSGGLTVHHLGLEELNEPYLAIKSAITINKNFSMEEPARLISEYLGLFSQKQKNIEEIIYPKNIKRLVPGF